MGMRGIGVRGIGVCGIGVCSWALEIFVVSKKTAKIKSHEI